MRRLTIPGLLALAWTGAVLADAPGPMEPKAAASPPQQQAAPAVAPPVPAQTPAAPQSPSAPAGSATAAPAASLQKVAPAPVSPRFNDVMTAVIYSDPGTVVQLLDLGRWVDKPDANGLTPLMVAVHLRDEGMVRLLLDRGADPNAQAPGGEVALEMAQANGEGGIESLLRRAGARR